jgi:trehalose 6-phosphate phosphatase
MPHLFDHLDSVQRFLSLPPLGLISDIDGTISRTAPTPAQAQVSPVCQHHLALLAKRLKLVALVSGRPVVQMRQMLESEAIVYIGNHGFERWAGGQVEPHGDVRRYRALIDAALEDLRPLLAIEGILFDNKGATATIHYRLVQDREAAKEQILAALAKSPAAKGLLVSRGKMAIELRPPVAVSKGSATLDLIRDYDLRRAIYLGDDLTDVEAFRAIHSGEAPNFKGLAIGVIDEEAAPEVEAEADFTLNGVDQVEQFLGWLAEAVGSA